jgi:hypothetical protein
LKVEKAGAKNKPNADMLYEKAKPEESGGFILTLSPPGKSQKLKVKAIIKLDADSYGDEHSKSKHTGFYLFF